MKHWVKANGNIVLTYRDEPVRAARELVRYNAGRVWNDGVNQLTKRVQYGPSPFGRADEWDALIVLDTCRADALQAVADEYDWLPDNIPSTRSPASWSRDWVRKACDPDDYGDVMQETAAVCWNPFTGYESDARHWHRLDEVWRTVWDDELSCIPPEEITDRAIRTGRETDAERVFVWYQQPHAPYRTLDCEEPLTHDQVGQLETERETVWDLCIRGELAREDAWAAMLENLRWVLDDVERLLENLDAERVVLTADHGEAFGELGGLLWGHGAGLPHPALIRVPWVELTAEDTGTCQPAAPTDGQDDPDVAEQLEALGYR